MFTSLGPSGVVSIAVALIVFIESDRVQGEVTINDIIENVRRNEMLYDNLEVTMEREYTTGDRPAPKLDRGSIPARTSTSTHYVKQGGMFRLDMVGTSITGNGDRSEDRIRAFDGEITRVYAQSAIGNIVTGRRDDPDRIEPHMLLLRTMREGCVPLSAFLAGADAMRAYPLVKWLGDQGLGLSSSYKRAIEFAGLPCHEVWVVMTDRTGQPLHRYELLLAEDRNYLPLRLFLYTFAWSSQYPVSEAEVTDCQQVAPDVWFPSAAKHVSYDKQAIEQTGEQRVQWEETYNCEGVSLKPAYPRTYFQDVKFPEGTNVYEVEDGKIRRSYREGSPPGSAPPGSPQSRDDSHRKVLWAFHVLVGAAIASLVFAKWRSTVRHHP